MKSRAAMLLLALSTIATCGLQACGPRDAPISPSTQVDAGRQPMDAGCDPNSDPWGCCCFTANTTIVCPPGVTKPDAGVLTLPVCGG